VRANRRGIHRCTILVFGVAGILFSSCVCLRARDSEVEQTQTVPRYTNSSEGLRLFLLNGVAGAKSGDRTRVDVWIRETKIPDARGWYVATYGEVEGTKRAESYSGNVEQYEKALRENITKCAHEHGEVETRKVNDHPESDGGIEWGLFQGLKRPTDFYLAEWKDAGTPRDASGQRFNYFVFVGGRFRIQMSMVRVPLTNTSGNSKPAPIDSLTPRKIEQSISGTKYVTLGGLLTLTVPTGWITMEGAAENPAEIGAIAEANHESNIIILLFPYEGSAADFVRMIDDGGGTAFDGYKKVGESPMTVGGRESASLTYTYKGQLDILGIEIPRTLKGWMVFVREKDHYIVFECTTVEAFFGAKEAVFRAIFSSIHVDEN
jgi:hypothetical protein